MGLCPEFYKLEAWRKAGYTSLEDSRRRFWEAYFLPMDPNNPLCMAWKWRHGDVTKHTNGGARADQGEDVRHSLRGRYVLLARDCQGGAVAHPEQRVQDGL